MVTAPTRGAHHQATRSTMKKYTRGEFLGLSAALAGAFTLGRRQGSGSAISEAAGSEAPLGSRGGTEPT